MGSGDGEFDLWLETELARELGPLGNVFPSHAWVRPRSRLRALALRGGGTFAVKAAIGTAVAIFAVGATGTAMTGSANPTAWGQAIGEAAGSAVPVRSEEPSPDAPASTSTLPSASASSVAVGTSARHEQRSESRPAASHHPEPGHSPIRRVKPTPKAEGQNDQQDDQQVNGRQGNQPGDDTRPSAGGLPVPSSRARTQSHD